MTQQDRVVRLKDAVADRQAARKLDDQQLQQLLRMQDQSPPAAVVRQGWQLSPRLGLSAISVAVAGLVLAVWLGIMTPTQQGGSALARIADEVALNHLKLRPMEVKGSDLDTLRSYFTTLDFRPMQIDQLSGSQGRLLGGRYCSVQGKIAAQFRVQSIDGNLRTVYQAGYDPRVHGELPDVGSGQTPAQLMARGVTVMVWTQGGVLFAVTGE